MGPVVQAQGAKPTPALLGPPGSDTQPGLGPVVLGHREQFVAGMAASFGLAQRCLVRVLGCIPLSHLG